MAENTIFDIPDNGQAGVLKTMVHHKTQPEATSTILKDAVWAENGKIPADFLPALELSSVMSLISGIISKKVTFSSSIPFDSSFTKMDDHIVSIEIVFTKQAVNQFAGAGALVRLTADGSNFPNFTEFKKSTNSSSYINQAGVMNVLFFFFDGTDYWINIWQEAAQTPILQDTSVSFSPSLITNINFVSPQYVSNYNGNGWQTQHGVSDFKIPANTDGYVQFKYSASNIGSVMLAFSNVKLNVAWNDPTNPYTYICHNFAGAYNINGGMTTGSPYATGDIVRLRRSGVSFIAEISKDNGTSFVIINTTTGHSNDLYLNISMYEGNGNTQIKNLFAHNVLSA